MRLALLPLILAAPLAACNEAAPPVGPTVSSVASLTTVDATDPISDAINRIAPAFGDDAAGLQNALLRVQKNETAALALAEQYLNRIERTNSSFAADVDAVRLAIAASR